MTGYGGLGICGRSRPADMEGRRGLHDMPEGDGLGTRDKSKGGLLSLFPLEVDLVAGYEQNSLKPSSQ